MGGGQGSAVERKRDWKSFLHIQTLNPIRPDLTGGGSMSWRRDVPNWNLTSLNSARVNSSIQSSGNLAGFLDTAATGPRHTDRR